MTMNHVSAKPTWLHRLHGSADIDRAFLHTGDHNDEEEDHSPHHSPHHHHQYHQHYCHASQPFADSDRRAAVDRGSNSQHRRMHWDSKSGKVHTISGNKGRFTLFFEICNHDIVISPSYEIHKNIKYLRYLATKVDLC